MFETFLKVYFKLLKHYGEDRLQKFFCELEPGRLLLPKEVPPLWVRDPLPPVPWKRENSIGRQEQSTPNLTCSHQLSYLLEQGIAVWKRLWVRHLSCSSALARGVSAPLLHPACSPSPGRTGGYCWGSSAGLLLRMHICSGSSMVISTSTHQ